MSTHTRYCSLLIISTFPWVSVNMVDTAAADNSSTLSHSTHTFFNGLLPAEDWWRFRLGRCIGKGMIEQNGDEGKWNQEKGKREERDQYGDAGTRKCTWSQPGLTDLNLFWCLFVLSSDCCERNAAAFEVRVGSEHLTDTLSSNNDVKTWIKQKKWKTRKPAVKHERCEEETSVHSTFCRSEAKDGNHNKHVIMKKITTSSAISRL